MFNNVLTVTGQVLILYLLMSVGYGMTKLRRLSQQTTKQITDLLLMVVTPCLIVNSFQNNIGNFDWNGLLWVALICSMTIGIAIVLSLFFYRRREEGQRAVLRYCMIYGNVGFMGIPLFESILGAKGVFYGSVIVVVFNLFVWTHGVLLMNGSGQQIKLSRALINPGTIGLLAGLPFYLFSVSFPAPIAKTVSLIASLNTPLAMLVIGSFIARSNLRTAFSDRRVYVVSLVRLVLVPACMCLLLLLLPVPNKDVSTVCLVAAGTPVAAYAVLFSEKAGRDTALSSSAVTVCTLLSVLTIPVLASIGRSIL